MKITIGPDFLAEMADMGPIIKKIGLTKTLEVKLRTALYRPFYIEAFP
jgi:hypothetical protein